MSIVHFFLFSLLSCLFFWYKSDDFLGRFFLLFSDTLSFLFPQLPLSAHLMSFYATKKYHVFDYQFNLFVACMYCMDVFRCMAFAAVQFSAFLFEDSFTHCEVYIRKEVGLPVLEIGSGTSIGFRHWQRPAISSFPSGQGY